MTSAKPKNNKSSSNKVLDITVDDIIYQKGVVRGIEIALERYMKKENSWVGEQSVIPEDILNAVLRTEKSRLAKFKRNLTYLTSVSAPKNWEAS
jgi:hypothetical protein